MAPSGKNKYSEALPTEWKCINTKCIILKLNDSLIKNSSFNGLFEFSLFSSLLFGFK